MSELISAKLPNTSIPNTLLKKEKAAASMYKNNPQRSSHQYDPEPSTASEPSVESLVPVPYPCVKRVYSRMLLATALEVVLQKIRSRLFLKVFGMGVLGSFLNVKAL